MNSKKRKKESVETVFRGIVISKDGSEIRERRTVVYHYRPSAKSALTRLKREIENYYKDTIIDSFIETGTLIWRYQED